MIGLDKIYNEDCLVGMKRIPDSSVDCVICDLPYEVLNKGNKNAQWDRVIPFEPLWEQYLRVSKENAAIILFAQGMFTCDLMNSNRKLWRYNLIWDKRRPSGFLNANRMPLRSHEDICVFYRQLPTYNPQMVKDGGKYERGGPNSKSNNVYGKIEKREKSYTDERYPQSILSYSKKVLPGQHPTQKPVDLIAYLVRTYSNEGEVILDNCMGSGTTAIACMRENRHFIGFELNKDYYDKANERIEQEKAQLKLF